MVAIKVMIPKPIITWVSLPFLLKTNLWILILAILAQEKASQKSFPLRLMMVVILPQFQQGKKCDVSRDTLWTRWVTWFTPPISTVAFNGNFQRTKLKTKKSL